MINFKIDLKEYGGRLTHGWGIAMLELQLMHTA